jgi:hypothetical protein
MRAHRSLQLLFRPSRAIVVALLIAIVSATSASAAGPSGRPARDPAVITDWNETAVAVIATDAAITPPVTYLWLAFTHAAMYNAVVGITERYEPYLWNPSVPRRASPEAAAATAAYRLLVTYFPASKARLDEALHESLMGIPDRPAKFRGMRFGELAAARIIRLREDDGRGGTREFTKLPAPGVWRPTPPAEAPFAAAWLSRVRPLTLRSPDQFRPSHPPFLTLRKYARDLNEVKEIGSKTSASRTPSQTETALFFSDVAGGPFQAGLRDLATRHDLDISDSARMFAAVYVSVADSLIAVWDAKFHFGYWRPITAIHRADKDGNPDTTADPAWEPLVTTPPYAEYPSGLTAVVASMSRALKRVLGTRRIDLFVTSAAAGVTRHYEFAGQFRHDAAEARIWSGIHFRSADAVGVAMGKTIARWALDRYFAPQ